MIKMDREKLSYILIGLALLLILIAILWYGLTNSPTTEQFIALLILSPYLFAFGVYERLSRKGEKNYERLNDRINGNYEKLNDKISQTREEFQHEMGEIKQTLGRIEGKLNTKI